MASADPFSNSSLTSAGDAAGLSALISRAARAGKGPSRKPGKTPPRGDSCAMHEAGCRCGGSKPSIRYVGLQRRLAKATDAPLGIDDMADVPIRAMDPLTARWAHERVVVKRRDHRDPDRKSVV